jgi:phage-related baseplate assembly protein
LESAIKSVEGVSSLLIEDMVDGVPGIVKVIVDGGKMEEIQSVIDNTRAAGIRVEVFRPKIVRISVSLMLILEKEAPASVIVGETEKRIRSYISSLGIGDDVLYSRLVESIVSPEGVWDVQNVRMAAHRPEGPIVESEHENLEISNEERAEPGKISVSFETRK